MTADDGLDEEAAARAALGRLQGDMEVIDLVDGDDDEEEEEEFDYGDDDDDEVEVLETRPAEEQQQQQESLPWEGESLLLPEDEDDAEAAARAALLAATAETGEEHWWCTHPDLAGSWLRAVVCGDGNAGSASGEGGAAGAGAALFEKLKGDTYSCLNCQDKYGEARRMVHEYLRSQDGPAEEMVAGLSALDRDYLLVHLRAAHGSYMTQGQLPDSFVFCLLDLLVHADIYFGDGAPPEIDSLFTELICCVGPFVEMNEETCSGRHLPGVYMLLTHANSGVRAFAAKLVKAMGQVSLETFTESIAPTFRSWYKVLEDEYLRGSAQRQHQPLPMPPQRGGGPDAAEVWKALRCFLEQVGGPNEALGGHILFEYPLLAEIVIQHAEEKTAPGRGGGASPTPVPTQRVALGTLGLLLDRFGPAVWRHAEGVSAASVLEWLRSRLLASGGVSHACAGGAQQPVALVEGVFVAALRLVRVFLRSLAQSRRGGSIDDDDGGGLAPRQPHGRSGSRVSLVDSALRTLARLGRELPVTAPLASRRMLEATLCDVVGDAYDPMANAAGAWPLASAEEWAPLLVAAMGPFGTVDARVHEERARATVLLVLRQHARDVRERVLTLARGGLADEDESEEGEEERDGGGMSQQAAPDFFCRRLMHELARLQPVQHLSRDIRDCLFSIQAALFLAAPLHDPRHHASLSASQRGLLSQVRDQTAAFRGLLVRYGQSPAELNPLAQHAQAVGSSFSVPLASVVPLLLLGDDEVALKQSLLVLLARAAGRDAAAVSGAALDWATVAGAVAKQDGAEPLLSGLWRGAAAVVKDLRKAGVAEAGSALALLPRFLELVRDLTAASGPERLKATGGAPLADVWWRTFGLELLTHARQRFLAGPIAAVVPQQQQQQQQLLSPPLLRGFCEVTRALLPGLSPARLRAHESWGTLLLDWANDPRLETEQHCVIELLFTLLVALRGNGIALKESVRARIQRLASAQPGSAGDMAAVEPTLGRRLQALVKTEPLLIEGEGPRATPTARGPSPVVDISDEDDPDYWPMGPVSPSPPSSPRGESAATAAEFRLPKAAGEAAGAMAAEAVRSQRLVEVVDVEDEEKQGTSAGAAAARSALPFDRPSKIASSSSASSSSGPVRPCIVLTAGEKKASTEAAQGKGGEPQGPYQQRRLPRDTLTTAGAAPVAVAPLGRVLTRAADDDFELFRHLKSVSKRAPLLARALHAHVLRWSLPALLAREPTAALDSVPLRFRDPVHYRETFVPLVLEELRASLGGSFQEGLQRRREPREASVGRGAGRGNNGPAGHVGESMTLDLQTARADGEGDELATLQMLFDYRRNRLQGRLRGANGAGAGGGQSLFLLRPLPAVAQGRLERDGEGGGAEADDALLLEAVLDHGGRVRGRSGDASSTTAATEKQGAQREPHLLAVLLDIGEEDQEAGGGDVWRLRVAISPQAPAAGGVRWPDFKRGSRWTATIVGSLTTALREFAAVHELLELRLAPRLLSGGTNQMEQQSAHTLEEIDLPSLVGKGREIEASLKRCEAAVKAGGQPSPADLETLRRRIRALRWLRVSQRLLKESNMGKLIAKRCGRAPWPAIQEAAGRVVSAWQAQVEAEKDCYKGEVPETVLAGASQQGESQGTGGGSQDRRASVASMSQQPEQQNAVVRCPIQLPLGLFKVLRKKYNSPQLRAIVAATHIHSKSFKRGFAVTLLQGPPGTGKTNTIIGLLSALINSSDQWRHINTARRSSGGGGSSSTSTTSNANVRPSLRPQGSGGGRGNRILVCAPSNGAVDELTLRLWRTGLLDAEGRAVKLPIIRVGTVDPDSADPSVQEASLDWQVEREVETSSEKQNFSVADAEVVRLREAVAAATEAGARRAQSRSKEGQISEAEWLRDAEARRRAARAELVRMLRQRWTALQALEALRSRVRNRLIKQAKIVLATLSSSAVPYLAEAVLSSARGFSTVVIDEAGQAVEPSSLIPLKFGAKNLVLVGDPRQLPATVLSKAAPEKGYDRSLFERLERGGHPVYTLRVQYRMDPAIRAFPSAEFYGDKLLDASEIHARLADPSSPSVFLRQAPYFPPYLVIDAAHGREAAANGERSLANDAEASLALGICQRLWLEFPSLGAEHLAVITPYRSQVTALHRRFRAAIGDAYGRSVELSTVDGFQGREKDIIIFSCVRTVPGRLGFIQDMRRLNVALTRARHSLFVLGSCNALASHETWCKLVDDARGRGCLVRVGERERGFDDLALRILRASDASARALPSAAAATGRVAARTTGPSTLPAAAGRAKATAAATAAAVAAPSDYVRQQPPFAASMPSSCPFTASPFPAAVPVAGGLGQRKAAAAPAVASSRSSPGTDALLNGLLDRAEASASAAAAAERAISMPPSSSGRDKAAIEAERRRDLHHGRQQGVSSSADPLDSAGWLPRLGSGKGSQCHSRSQSSSRRQLAAPGPAAASSASSSSSCPSAATHKHSSHTQKGASSSSSRSGGGGATSKKRQAVQEETLRPLGTSKRRAGGTSHHSSGGGGGGSNSGGGIARPSSPAPGPDDFVIPKKAGAAPSARAAAAAAAAAPASRATQPVAAGKKPKKPSFSVHDFLSDA